MSYKSCKHGTCYRCKHNAKSDFLEPCCNCIQFNKFELCENFKTFTDSITANASLSSEELDYISNELDILYTYVNAHTITVPSPKQQAMGQIKKVIFNDPATIVLWKDGTKTVIKAHEDKFDPEKGLAMAISKKFFGNKGYYYDVFKKWLPSEEKGGE